MRQIIDDPLTPANNFLLDKLSSASFNLNPPKILKPTSTWDVNILLDHFVQMGPNEKFKSVNRLGGKLMLQLLLTQMRRSGEIAQLQLSTMRLLQGAMEFELTTPTKTFNPRNQGHTSKLQRITVCKFEGDSLLCPLTTLLAYLEMTRHRRGWVDHLFVLVTTQTPRRATFNPRNQGHTSKLQRITVCKFEGDSLLFPLTTLLAYLEMTYHRRGWVDHLFVLVTTQTPRRATHASIVRWSKDVMMEAGIR